MSLLWYLWLKVNDCSDNFIPNIPCLKWTNGLSDSFCVSLFLDVERNLPPLDFFIHLKHSHSSRQHWGYLPHKPFTWSALNEWLFSAIKLFAFCYPSAKLTIICPELLHSQVPMLVFLSEVIDAWGQDLFFLWPPQSLVQQIFVDWDNWLIHQTFTRQLPCEMNSRRPWIFLYVSLRGCQQTPSPLTLKIFKLYAWANSFCKFVIFIWNKGRVKEKEKEEKILKCFTRF